MKIMALDASTKSTGISLWANGELVAYKLIRTPLKNMDDRFKDMCILLLRSLDSWSPDEVFLEETVVARNVQVQRFLTRLQGVVYCWCIQNDKKFNTIRPTVWRKAVGIKQGKKKRDELKQDAISLVNNELNIIDVTDDVAESICIGLAALSLFEEKEN